MGITKELDRSHSKVLEICAVIDIKPRHFVEADNRIEVLSGEGFLRLLMKVLITPPVVTTDTAGRENREFKIIGRLALPLGCINMYLIPAATALIKDA